MNRMLMLTPAAIALAMALAAPPASAQSRDRGQQTRDRSAQAKRPAGRSADAARSQPRGEAVRRGEPRNEPSRGGASSPPSTRGYTTSRGAPPPARTPSGTRGYATSRNTAPQAGGRRYESGPPPRQYNSGSYYNGGYGNRSYRPYGSYNRDAWRGRVHFGLGLSIFAGNPFYFRFDYGWRPSFAYYYAMRPGLAYGGMSFLLSPDFAEVYIDGQYVGIARDFGGQPVPVAAGYHRIELYAPGYAPVAFDIQVYPGQVMPYRGTLFPVY